MYDNTVVFCCREEHEKVNMTWNDNDTITFQLVKKWYFDPQNSKGSLADNITTLNPVSLVSSPFA